ncbi:hypothetical protein SCWH03_30190 [Streptomyces pacificus]|uniref:Uncharacterized protein n=1 Tax=Streptomyces pacificus TaxID=2705029 RepID=A0A6A0AV68_9ACTN|nr:hypothetical protein SCWH03_30190 [Streptomyces pacificus]
MIGKIGIAAGHGYQPPVSGGAQSAVPVRCAGGEADGASGPPWLKADDAGDGPGETAGWAPSRQPTRPEVPADSRASAARRLCSGFVTRYEVMVNPSCCFMALWIYFRLR